MKRKLRGLQRRALDLDFDLYRVEVPIKGLRNAELSVIDMEPEGAERCLVFVHGYAGCLETWEAQISAFARRDRVVAPDLRGHGQSDAPYTRYTLDELVSDLETVVEMLALPPTFNLIGHSFGGAVAATYALRHPERVARLVLIATPVSFPLPASVSLLRRIPTAVYRPLWRFRPRWNAEPHVLKRMMLSAMCSWEGGSVLAAIKTKTLIITGDRDTYFPKRVFEGSIEAMPEAEVVNVGASKHKVQLERHQAVNRAIERFLDARAGSWRESGRVSELKRRRPWLSLYHELTPPTLPLPRQPLDSFLRRAAENVPKRAAIRFFDRRINYQALDRRVNQVARAIHGLGLQPDDRILVLLPNCPELVMAIYGAWRAGCTVLLPSIKEREEGFAALLARSEAALAFISEDALARFEAGGERKDPIEIVTVRQLDLLDHGTSKSDRGAIGEKVPATQSAPSRAVDFDDLLVDVEDSEIISLAESETMALIYLGHAEQPESSTSLSHGNLVANAVQIRHWLPGLRFGEERCLSAIPLSHAYGLGVAVNLPIMLGATLYILPNLNVQPVLATIRDAKPTFLPGLPSLYAAINQSPSLRAFGLQKVKLFLSGMAPLPVEVHEAFEKLSKSQLIEVYGLREASAITHANPPGERRYPGLIGLPLPNTDARIIDAKTGATRAQGEIGEIQVRGPQVARSMEPGQAAEGWLSTGDLGVMEVDGSFRFLSRAEDWICTAGIEVFPRDIEEALVEHHDILEAVVTADSVDVEQLHLIGYIVPRPFITLDVATVAAFAERRLPANLRPVRFHIVDTLPKDRLGRVDRRRLSEPSG